MELAKPRIFKKNIFTSKMWNWPTLEYLRTNNFTSQIKNRPTLEYFRKDSTFINMALAMANHEEHLSTCSYYSENCQCLNEEILSL